MKRFYKVRGGCVLYLMCVKECPKGAISIIEDVSVRIDPDKCVGCGKCANACQTESIVPVQREA